MSLLEIIGGFALVAVAMWAIQWSAIWIINFIYGGKK